MSRVPRSTPKRALGLCAAALLAAALVGCKRAQGEDGPPDVGPMIVSSELYGHVAREKISVGPQIPGTLEPGRQALLRAEIGGSLSEANVEVGEHVTAGQVLARIAAPALPGAVSAARAMLRAAEREAQVAQRQVQRTRNLVRAGALADRDLEVAEGTALTRTASLEEARARLAAAVKDLGGAVIRAPITGVVSAKEAHQGDVVSAGAALFTIVDPSSMRLEAQVSSQDLSGIVVGAPVAFEVRGYPGLRFEGRIARIAPAADPATRQVPIWVTIPNPGGQLIAGLFAEGRIATQVEEALVVAPDALDERGGATAVTCIRDGRAQRVPVEVGIRDERAGRVQVSGDLRAGDVVLIGPAAQIAPGTPVQLRPELEGAGSAAALAPRGG